MCDLIRCFIDPSVYRSIFWFVCSWLNCFVNVSFFLLKSISSLQKILFFNHHYLLSPPLPQIASLPPPPTVKTITAPILRLRKGATGLCQWKLIKFTNIFIIEKWYKLELYRQRSATTTIRRRVIKTIILPNLMIRSYWVQTLLGFLWQKSRKIPLFSPLLDISTFYAHW